MSMYVKKRNGRRESVHFDKITSRIKKLCYGLDAKVSDNEIASRAAATDMISFIPDADC